MRYIYREDVSVAIFPPELDELTRFPATEISHVVAPVQCVYAPIDFTFTLSLHHSVSQGRVSNLFQKLIEGWDRMSIHAFVISLT